MGFNTNMTSMVTFWMMGTPILGKLLRDDRRRDGQRPSDALQMRPLKNITGSLGTARPPFWRSWMSYFIDMLQIQSHESHKWSSFIHEVVMEKMTRAHCTAETSVQFTNLFGFQEEVGLVPTNIRSSFSVRIQRQTLNERSGHRGPWQLCQRLKNLIWWLTPEHAVCLSKHTQHERFKHHSWKQDRIINLQRHFFSFTWTGLDCDDRGIHCTAVQSEASWLDHLCLPPAKGCTGAPAAVGKPSEKLC